jgi:hypothetical protein
MKKFLALYSIPSSVMDEWKKTPPDTRKAEEDKLGREIQAWMKGRAKTLVDPGAGLGKTTRITSSGIAAGRNDLVMYAIVQGDSQDAVAKALESHPHLQIPQASIDVMELFAMPDQAK